MEDTSQPQLLSKRTGRGPQPDHGDSRFLRPLPPLAACPGESTRLACMDFHGRTAPLPRPQAGVIRGQKHRGSWISWTSTFCLYSPYRELENSLICPTVEPSSFLQFPRNELCSCPCTACSFSGCYQLDCMVISSHNPAQEQRSCSWVLYLGHGNTWVTRTPPRYRRDPEQECTWGCASIL